MIEKYGSSSSETCLPFEKGSERVRCFLVLVDPTRLDMDPSNLWESWVWRIAMERARRCNISSSASNFLCERFILMLLDPSFLSFFIMEIILLPIFSKSRTKSDPEAEFEFHRTEFQRNSRGNGMFPRKVKAWRVCCPRWDQAIDLLLYFQRGESE